MTNKVCWGVHNAYSYSYMELSEMSGLFAYAQVTPGSKPTAAAELRQAAAVAGHVVLPDNTVIETVTGLAAPSARSGWRGLLDRMYEGDVIVLLTLGDLGRDVREVCVTVKRLARMGLRVHCLELGQGRVDLASPAGQPSMEVLTAVAGFDEKQRVEHKRLDEAVDSTLMFIRRKGRPPSLSLAQIAEARRLLGAGVSTVQVAQHLGTSRQTIMRARARHN
jgi:putative DNA-invertase from lambdoid prophage Rac